MSLMTPMRITWPWARARGRPPPSAAAAPVASNVRLSMDMSGSSPLLWLRLHDAAATLVQRPEGLLGRRGLQQLVVVPGRLALLGLLHLEEVARAELAAVLADAAGAEG